MPPTATPATRQSLPAAVALMVLASLSFAGMQAFVKDVTRDQPFLLALLARGVAGLVPLALWFAATGRRPRARRPRRLLLRSALGFAAMTLFFLAIRALPMPTATVLNYSSPVFVVLLSAPLLGERRVGARLPFVALAVAGVALLVDAEAAGSPLAVGVGVLSALFAGLAYVTVRDLTATEAPDVIVWHFTAWTALWSAALLAAATLAGRGGLDGAALEALRSDPGRWASLAAVGLLGTAGQVSMTAAYARSEAGVVAPFSCLNPVLSYAIGLWLFDDPLSAKSLAGGGLVLLATVGLLVLEARRPGPAARAPGRTGEGG